MNSITVINRLYTTQILYPTDSLPYTYQTNYIYITVFISIQILYNTDPISDSISHILYTIQIVLNTDSILHKFYITQILYKHRYHIFYTDSILERFHIKTDFMEDNNKIMIITVIALKCEHRACANTRFPGFRAKDYVSEGHQLACIIV